ncbi:hypothetical protein OAF27_01765 [Verrucomicrobiales bacterium]|nr:hypothetical protein [Verrucomicrobiales bacterium]
MTDCIENTIFLEKLILMKFIKKPLRTPLLSALIFLSASASQGAIVITNGSFETGDFTGWIATDLGVPFDPLVVEETGTNTNFGGFGATVPGTGVVTPTDGDFAVNNGFDGGGPGQISVAQDVGVVSAGDVLEYDFRAGWDLENFNAAVDRMFGVDIEPAGGGAPLLSFTDITAPAGTFINDTGALSASHDLSALAGIDVRVNFVWNVPENFTGPANGQLDAVRVVQANVPSGGNTLLMLGGSLLGFGFLRRLVS